MDDAHASRRNAPVTAWLSDMDGVLVRRGAALCRGL